jgi:ubiquinone/menaquinone biosynthesis C-methylase UbiE
VRHLKAPAEAWKRWYDFLAGREQWFVVHGLAAAGEDLRHWRFMNAGYASASEPADESGSVMEQGDRLSVRLYEHLLEHAHVADRDVVEVGSGRGGGCEHIARHKGARSVTGVDLSDAAVSFCQRQYDVKGLKFVVGNAESLPLDDASVDVVLNVESSHCYDDFSRFVREVHRVLRPGGRLLLTDFRPRELVADVRSACAAQFRVEAEVDITPEIVRALHTRWRHPLTSVLATGFESPLARARWQETAGPHVSIGMAEPTDTDAFFFLKDSRSDELFTSGEWRYFTFVLVKDSA